MAERIIYYVNIGNLPKTKIEEHVRKCRQDILDQGKLHSHETLWVVPVRGNDPTRIEVLST